MPDLQPEHALFFRDVAALPWLSLEHQTTRRVIEAIPLAEVNYRPHPASRGALDLAKHLVSAELRYLNGVVHGEFDLAPINELEMIRDSRALGSW